MTDKKENTIYFISIVNKGKILIVDGISKNIIKEIDLGSRPRNIVIGEAGRVYVTNDMHINIIEDLKAVMNLDVPNNGNLQVDSLNKKIYICNTEEIYIYNLENGERTDSLTGFISAERLELDSNLKRLLVLDILERKIKVYNTDNLKLIDTYEKVGIAPYDFLLGEKGEHLFIANKGLRNRGYKCYINIIDLETKRMSNVEMPRGSSIKSLAQEGNYLYAANRALNRIDVIDIGRRKLVTEIKTSLPIVDRVGLSKDKEKLFAISRNQEGFSVVDIISTDEFTIKDSLNFESDNKVHDIGDIVFYKSHDEDESLIFMKLEDES